MVPRIILQLLHAYYFCSHSLSHLIVVVPHSTKPNKLTARIIPNKYVTPHTL